MSKQTVCLMLANKRKFAVNKSSVRFMHGHIYIAVTVGNLSSIFKYKAISSTRNKKWTTLYNPITKNTATISRDFLRYCYLDR